MQGGGRPLRGRVHLRLHPHIKRIPRDGRPSACKESAGGRLKGAVSPGHTAPRRVARRSWCALRADLGPKLQLALAGGPLGESRVRAVRCGDPGGGMMENGEVDALQDAIERLLKHQQRARRTADPEDRMPILIRIADARIEVRRTIKAVQVAAEAGDRDAADALELLRFLSNPGGRTPPRSRAAPRSAKVVPPTVRDSWGRLRIGNGLPAASAIPSEQLRHAGCFRTTMTGSPSSSRELAQLTRNGVADPNLAQPLES